MELFFLQKHFFYKNDGVCDENKGNTKYSADTNDYS
jgi:hypothetical protein